VRIVEVTITRAEGKHSECGSVTVKGDWAEELADLQLRRISQTAPRDGGYHKVDVRLKLENGEEVFSRHDVQRGDTDGTVREHAIRWLTWAVEHHHYPGHQPWDAKPLLEALSKRG